MEIILKQDFLSLGHVGEIVKVKDGFGRNYLVPKGFAVLATESAKKVQAENSKQSAHKEDRLIKEAKQIIEQLKSKTFVVGAKTSTTGKIFGSVNTIQLAEEMSKKGFDIDRKKIVISNEPIKEVGKYKAIVKLYKGVQAEIEFEVVAE